MMTLTSWVAGSDIFLMAARPSVIILARTDPVFRVTGFKERSRRVPMRLGCQCAAPIRNVANPQPDKLLLVSTIVLVMIAIVVGVAQWFG